MVGKDSPRRVFKMSYGSLSRDPVKKNNWKHSITLVKFHSQDRRLKHWVIE